MTEQKRKTREEENLSSVQFNLPSNSSIEKPVMILKRPSAITKQQDILSQKPRIQIKSLPQRQKEYAEARMRILGSLPVDR